MLAVKLAALPLVALLVAHLLGMPPLESRMLLLFGALPTASAAYMLAMRMGGDGAWWPCCCRWARWPRR